MSRTAKYTRVERIRTGILELDRYLQGGIPTGSWVFIAGEPGTGKTILCLHIAYTNLKEGLPVIYITTEQPFKDLVQQARQFHMDLTQFTKAERSLYIIDIFDLWNKAWEAKKEGRVRYADPLDPDNLCNYILTLCSKNNINNPLIIIDSLSAFWVDKPAMARRITYNMKLRLNRLRATVVGTLQYAVTTGGAFGFGAEHIADGIIQMFIEPVEKVRGIRRWGIIKKMRLTNHHKEAWEFDIVEDKGLVIK